MRALAFAPFFTAVLIVLPSTASSAEPPARIVFIGDSITDGHTLPLLVRQALADGKQPVPVCINAGVASDTAALMRARLARDVLPHRPTLVTLSAGINDVLRGVKPEDYEKDVDAIVEKLKAEKVPVVLLTPSILGPKHEAAEEVGRLHRRMRKIAATSTAARSPRHEAMKRDRAGKECIEPDQSTSPSPATGDGVRRWTRWGRRMSPCRRS